MDKSKNLEIIDRIKDNLFIFVSFLVGKLESVY